MPAEASSYVGITSRLHAGWSWFLVDAGFDQHKPTFSPFLKVPCESKSNQIKVGSFSPIPHTVKTRPGFIKKFKQVSIFYSVAVSDCREYV